MSADTQKAFAGTADNPEPQSGRSPAPILLIALFALLVFWGMTYLDAHGGGFSPKVYEPYLSVAQVDAVQPVIDGPDPRLGKQVFDRTCVACHQSSGLGVPGQFPPLVGSEWVAVQSPNRILRAVLNGLSGPITVKGQPFNNSMVPWNSLSNAEIAAVLTYVRQNKDWGNNAPAVTEDQVKAIRTKIADHPQSFTPDELLKIPEGQ
jgi:mono/diheme cytochrome c family protein